MRRLTAPGRITIRAESGAAHDITDLSDIVTTDSIRIDARTVTVPLRNGPFRRSVRESRASRCLLLPSGPSICVTLCITRSARSRSSRSRDARIEGLLKCPL